MAKTKETISMKPYDVRGLVGLEFEDANGERCTIQESSACAVEGGDGAFAASDHGRRATASSSSGARGGRMFPCRKGRKVFGRMHLSQRHVAALLPLLKHFAKHGELPKE